MRLRYAVVGALLVGGCAYYNSLYNANRSFAEAENARRDGREAFAQTKYLEAIDKAAKSYRSAEDGRWADDALYLIGRAHARRGDWLKAQGALEAALEKTDSPRLAAGARVYLGAAAVSLGDDAKGLALLDSALIAVDDDEIRGEAYLWRARARYGAGEVDAVWSDLDSAAVGGDRYRVEAALDRLTWAVDTGNMDQARAGSATLQASTRAAAAGDTIEALLRTAWVRWGAAEALPLLEGAQDAAWPPERRNGLLLLQAQVSYQAGDFEAAQADARRVAAGVGRQADAGRVLLARWRMREMQEPAELDEVRAMLLSAVGSPEAVRLLDVIKTVGLLVERSRRESQEVALFAAGELARDSLDAPGLARTLFLAYADLSRGSAWEGKALLAALATTTDPAVRKPIEDRLARIPDNAYVMAARWDLGDREGEFTAIERRLQGVLGTIRAQVAAEAATRDVIVSRAAQALDSIRVTESIARRLAEGDSSVLDSLRADSLRLDSIRLDSLRSDSVRGLDSLFLDTLPLDTTGSGRRPPGERPRPLLLPLRDPAGEGQATPVERPGYESG